MSDPLVSVILPTHNRAQLVDRAIRSVLAQSYPSFELIVVDDASDDETPQLVRAFDDPRVRYLQLESNRRAAAARNLGVEEARGDLLAFQDDDDIWLPDKLRQQVPALLAEPAEVGLNICSHIKVRSGRALHVGGEKHWSSLRFDAGLEGLDFSLVATPGWLLRRECFERVGGFDERMRCWDDWELAARLAQQFRFTHLDEVLWLQDRRRDGPGMFDNSANFANDHRIIAETLAADWSPPLASRQWFLTGYFEAMQGDGADARAAFRHAVEAHPRNTKARLALALSYGGSSTVRAAAQAARRARRARSKLPSVRS